MNGGSPSASAAMGGAIARPAGGAPGRRRTSRSPVAAASTSASLGASSSGSNDCTGLRATTATPRLANVAASRAATYVLPISVPVPATRTIVTRSTRVSAEHVGERGEQPVEVLVGVRRAQGDAEARRAAARPWADGSRGRSARVRASRRPLRPRGPPRRTRRARWATDGPSRTRSTFARRPRDERSAFYRAQDSERRERRRAVGGRGCGGEDVGPAAGSRSARRSAGARRRIRPANRGTWSTSRRAARRRRASRSTVGPSTACASSSTSSACSCAQISTSAARSATSPSIEKTVSLTTSAAGRHRCGCGAGRAGVRSRRGGTPRCRRVRGGSRR